MVHTGDTFMMQYNMAICICRILIRRVEVKNHWVKMKHMMFSYFVAQCGGVSKARPFQICVQSDTYTKKSTKMQTLGAKRVSCSIAVCWAVRHRRSQ